MLERTLDFDSLIVLSETRTPIVCPPDLSICRDDFYDGIRGTVEEYNLPVRCADCAVRFGGESEPRTHLIIALVDQDVPYLRVLLGLEKFGGLAYAERRLILTPPDLPPPITADSNELPPRLTPASDELTPAMSESSQTRKQSIPLRFKSEVHEARFMEMERRRRKRREIIEERKEERQAIVDSWLEQVNEVIAQFTWNPRLTYFKDSVDTVLQTAIEELEARGAHTREEQETVREQEELNRRVDELSKRFY